MAGANDHGTLSLANQRAPLPDDVPAPGQRVGRFVITARLGEGGMGVVLAGHDPDLDRRVAIKLLRAGVDAPGYRARLVREAQALARLHHPNVVSVYEVGEDRDRIYIAMELVVGTTLTRWIAARRRPWREVVTMFVAVGQGLAAVHDAGLVHRDFKPDNVLVDGKGRARVADFGLARLVTDEIETGSGSPPLAQPLTRTGAVMGTPGYMAPEQQWGSDVDARADQYSFCVALRAALTGGAVTTATTIDSRDDPGAERKAAAREWARVPGRVRGIVMRGLSYDAADRYPAMDALLAALRDAVASRRARVAAVVGSAVFVAGIIATSIAIATGGHDDDAAAVAVADAATVAATDPAAVAAPAAAAAPGSASGSGPVSGSAPAAGTVPDAAPASAAAKDARVKDARPAAPAVAAGSGTLTSLLPPPPGGTVVLRPPVPFVRKDDPPPDAVPARLAAPPSGAALTRALAATVADLGLRGVRFDGDLADAEQELRDKIAALQPRFDALIDQKPAVDSLTANDLELIKVTGALGVLQRKRGDCAGAVATFTRVGALVHSAAGGAAGMLPTETQAWWRRAWFGRELCALAAGDLAGARAAHKTVHILFGVGADNAEQAEQLIAVGLTRLADGDVLDAERTFTSAWKRHLGVYRAAAAAWDAAVAGAN